jgi:RNA polymerase sigma-70 factor, ECF subfamily
MDQEDFARRTLEIEYSLYRVAKTLLRDDNDCADAVQDALLKGLNGMKTLQQAEYFKTWLTRILINTCKGMMKKRSRRPWQEIPETLPAPDTTEQQELYAALHSIPEEMRLTLVLHYLEGLTVREVSQVLKMPLGTVKRRLSEGKSRLHALLCEDREAM